MGESRMLDFLKLIKRQIRRFIRVTDRKVHSFRYSHFQSKLHSIENFKFHILVVKKKQYVALAKICVESFLYFHPNSSVIIHCDEVTFETCRKKFKVWDKRGRVTFKLLSEKEPWQLTKLKLILGLNGTNDYFVDADMRWNGTLTKKKFTSFYVNEFKLNDNALYSELLSRLNMSSLSTATMKNTSSGGHVVNL